MAVLLVETERSITIYPTTMGEVEEIRQRCHIGPGGCPVFGTACGGIGTAEANVRIGHGRMTKEQFLKLAACHPTPTEKI